MNGKLNGLLKIEKRSKLIYVSNGRTNNILSNSTSKLDIFENRILFRASLLAYCKTPVKTFFHKPCSSKDNDISFKITKQCHRKSVRPTRKY